MELSKIIYDVKEALRAYSNDAKVTNEYILHVVNITRAKYVRQHQRKNIGEDKVAFTQTLFANLEQVDRLYTPVVELATSKILRTIKPLPRIIGKRILKNIEVRPTNRLASELQFIDKSRAVFITGAEPGFIYCYLDDDMHIYFIGEDNISLYMQKVAITAILEEPRSIVAFNELVVDLVDYPLPEHMWQTMKPEVLDLLTKSTSIPIDEVDDNKTVQ